MCRLNDSLCVGYLGLAQLELLGWPIALSLKVFDLENFALAFFANSNSFSWI